jgi:hypothetical protein
MPLFGSLMRLGCLGQRKDAVDPDPQLAGLEELGEFGHPRSVGAHLTTVDGLDLFALVNAVGWISEQAPSIAVRREHPFALILDGLRPSPRPA